MTYDEIAELRRCSQELLKWMADGNIYDPPLDTIRKISLLSKKAADYFQGPE